jgi:hypothetical protein
VHENLPQDLAKTGVVSRRAPKATPTRKSTRSRSLSPSNSSDQSSECEEGEIIDTGDQATSAQGPPLTDEEAPEAEPESCICPIGFDCPKKANNRNDCRTLVLEREWNNWKNEELAAYVTM